MVEIKAGPELDRAVAEVIGAEWRESWKAADGCWKMAAWYFPDGTVLCRQEMLRFSTDLNAAWAAAERVGLFNEWSLSHYGDGWTFESGGTCPEWIGIEAPAAALAICAAILKMKGAQ